MALKEQLTPTQDVPDCADEPIHLPGSIQAHGFFLMTDAAVERVVVASENAADYLHLPLKLVLGARLDTLFERELLASIKLVHFKDDFAGQLGYLGAFRIDGDMYSVVTHIIGEHRVFEFERQDRLVGPETMNAIITNFVSSLARVRSERELFDSITEQVSNLTCFGRVMLYSFDDAGNGTVLSEKLIADMPSYMGLHFPASDIPAQARALYVQNTVRIIPNAEYVPSPLRSLSEAGTAPLDLSSSTLRSVSPTHIEYMKNMGTMASMSISIVIEGKLWG